ncbi:MAG: endonuclease V [Candidatus Thorarchaeota archaeon]
MKNLQKTLQEAESEQRRLAELVIEKDDANSDYKTVTGVDVSYRGTAAFACAVVYDLSTMKPVKSLALRLESKLPYIPNYFYLKEGPILIDLLEQFPDTGPVLIDGNGILHPRRFGLASYVGVKIDRPTIGIAKGLLTGKLGERDGDSAPILDSGEIIGKAVWLNNTAKPVFVSIGHRVSLERAIQISRQSTIRSYPEPLKLAHRCSKSNNQWN